MPQRIVLISGLLLATVFVNLTFNVCYKDCRATKKHKQSRFRAESKLLSNGGHGWKAGANRSLYDGKQLIIEVRKFDFYSHLWLEQAKHSCTLLDRAN